MKKASILTIVFIVIIMPFQASCAQSSPCPADREEAEQILKKYLSKERNIKSLGDNYDMPINGNTKDNIKSLSEEENQQECQQLRANLDWLEDEENYSIYKVADHYFIVIYSFDENGEFQWNEIPIVNSDYKFLSTVINFEVEGSQ